MLKNPFFFSNNWVGKAVPKMLIQLTANTSKIQFLTAKNITAEFDQN